MLRSSALVLGIVLLVWSCVVEAQDLRLTRVLQIGALDGPPEVLFYRVFTGAFDHDGFWLAHRGDQQIRKYSFSGELIRSLGRSGDGPGEFRQLLDVVITADGVTALDGTGRVTRFDSRGGAEIFQLPGVVSHMSLMRIWESPGGLRFLASTGLDPRPLRSSAQDSLLLLAVSADSTLRRVIAPVPYRWWVRKDVVGGFGLAAIESGPLGLVASGRVIATTANESGRVMIRDHSGSELGEWATDSLRPTAGDDEVGGRFFEQIVVGDQVWVSEARAVGPDRRWWAISFEGETLWSALLPASTRVLAAGTGRLLARSLDELGVERIEVWRFAGS